MKPLRKLSLLAVVVAGLIGSTGVASSTTLTSETGSPFPYTGPITAFNWPGHVILHGPLGIKVECSSHLEAEVETGGPSVTASGQIKGLVFNNCTNSYSVTVLQKGALEVHSDGTLTSTGSTITVTTPLGFNCEYTTNGTQLGALTETDETGGRADIDIAAVIPRTGHHAFCGKNGIGTGRYTVTTPERLFID